MNVIWNLDDLREYLRNEPDDCDVLRRLIIGQWWTGLKVAIIEFGLNPNRLIDGKHLMDFWRPDNGSIAEYKQLVDLGCNPFLCSGWIDTKVKEYFLERTRIPCRAATIAIISCNNVLTRDTRTLIAKCVWETRRDWETWV